MIVIGTGEWRLEGAIAHAWAKGRVWRRVI